MAHTLVTTFGRFQPPTKGHEVLLQEIIRKAAAVDGEPLVFLSHRHNTTDCPLTYDERVKLIRSAFRDTPLSVGPSHVKRIPDLIKWAQSNNYTKLIFVVGQDRVTDFREIAEEWTTDTFTIDVHGVSRDHARMSGPRKRRVSATLARNFAQHGNIEEFEEILMSGISPTGAKDTMHKIQSRLGSLSESRFYLPFLSFVGQLTEAEDEDDLVLQKASKKAESENEDLPTPSDELVSAEDLPSVVKAQKGTVDAREAERVPSDDPNQQSIVVIHPPAHLVRDMGRRLEQKREEDKERRYSAEELEKQD